MDLLTLILIAVIIIETYIIFKFIRGTMKISKMLDETANILKNLEDK